MISDSSSDKDSKSSKSSGDIDYPKSLPNSNLPNNFYQKSLSGNLNYSRVPMNLQPGTNPAVYGQNNINANQPKEEEGVFSKFFNFIKSSWTIEEEEFIDAHGFKAKRPKKKIPLRKKEDKLDSDIQMLGGQSVTYATQHTGFGNLFL